MPRHAHRTLTPGASAEPAAPPWPRAAGALLVALLLVPGCAAPGTAPQSAAPGASAPVTEATGGGVSDAPAVTPAVSAPPSPAPGGGSGTRTAALVRSAASVPRRIIYTAEVSLVAQDLTAAEKELVRLVKAHAGYIAQTETGGTPGVPRTGRWKARVPVGQFDAFMAALTRLGEVQRIHTDSQDVSEEYYDVEARLGNKQVEEQRLLKHLQGSTARLQDILSVERELSRVRGEIEQLQGRLRFLANQTELTTVTVTMDEVQHYAPPRGTSFAAQAGRTFAESLGLLQGFGRNLLLAVIAVVPWLVVLVFIAAPLWMLSRRIRLRRR